MSDKQPKVTSYVAKLSPEQIGHFRTILNSKGWAFSELAYGHWKAQKERTTVAAYLSGKVVVQGGGTQDLVLYVLEPEVLHEAKLGYESVMAEQENPQMFEPHAGIDESGKGDYFGPLVVCCCYTDEALSREMREMGVKDCKQMSDKSVLSTGAKLRALLGPTGYAVVKLGPAAYNRLYAKIRNINRMLAWAHGTAIEELLEKRRSCPRVVVDQFAPTEATILRALKARGKAVKVEQRHKAESDIAVAAASVIAREIFLRDIMKMGDELFGPPAEGRENVPAGSSDPRVRSLAEDMVRREGPVWLMNHAKAHFQTTDKVLAACGKSREDLPPEGRVVSASKLSAGKERTA